MLETTNVKTFWDPEEIPHFLSRTNTEYSKLPLSYLSDRGIENRLFTSLVNGLPQGAYIAGGFMTSVMQEDKQAKDIDIFFTSEKAFKIVYEQLRKPEEFLEKDPCWGWYGYKVENDEEEFIKDSKKYRFVKFVHPERPPIQLIKLVWYDSAEHIIDSFDLTLAQIAADGKKIYINPVSLLDIARKRIVLHRMQFPASTLRRLIKYSSKGYYACPGSLVKIAEESANVISRTPEALGQIVYVD